MFKLFRYAIKCTWQSTYNKYDRFRLNKQVGFHQVQVFCIHLNGDTNLDNRLSNHENYVDAVEVKSIYHFGTFIHSPPKFSIT